MIQLSESEAGIRYPAPRDIYNTTRLVHWLLKAAMQSSWSSSVYGQLQEPEDNYLRTCDRLLLLP